MPVTFDVGNGTTVSVQDDAQIMQTARGAVVATDVVQGDHICNMRGAPLLEVIAPPLVS